MRTPAGPPPPPSPRRSPHRHRAGLLGGAATLPVLALALIAMSRLRQATAELAGRPSVQVPDALGLLALAVLALALLWCAVLLAACAADLLQPPEGGTAVRGAARVPLHATPVLAGHISALLLALAALGTSASSALPAPDPAPVAAAALAGSPRDALILGQLAAPVSSFGPALPSSSPRPPSSAPPATAPALCVPAPGWTAARPVAVQAQGADQVRLLSSCPRAVEEGNRATVVVHRGDDLWSIVQRHLGADASAAQVAAEWPRWYAANHGVIGDDPNVLMPGWVLHAPEGARR